jgi:hypothetical protein
MKKALLQQELLPHSKITDDKKHATDAKGTGK